jgi:DNA-binding NarL/FixJ family response regulator
VHAIVGRDAELESIQAWLHAPDGRALLIEGDAGIGKTTVWRAGVEAASERGFRVLSSAPAQSEAQLSFTAIRDLLDDTYEELAASLPPPQRHALEVTLLREDPRGSPPESGAIALSLLSALRVLGGSTRVLVAIDDIQWLDAASAAPLEYALRRLDADSIVVLLARRAGEVEPAAIVESLGDRIDRIRIDPLTIGALGRVLYERLGTALPRPTLHRLHEVSGGNPFFALELARSLGDSGAPLRPGEPLPVPETQRELIQQRLEALPAETLDALAVASALSRPTLTHISAALGVDVRPARVAAARDDIARTDGNDVRFAHPLFAAATYELAAPRRHTLHARLAAIASDPEERALHLALATDEPDDDAARAIEDGARLAFARGSPEAAAQLTEEALRLTPAEDTAELSRRASDSGWYQFTAGDSAHARRLLTTAIETAPSGDERVRAVLRLASVEHHTRDRRAALVDLERITRDETVGNLEVLAEAHVLVAASYWVLHEDIPRAARSAREAVKLCEQLGDSGLLVSSLAVLGMCEFTLGSGLPSPAITRALDIEAGAGDGRVLRQPLQHWAAILLCADRYDEARALLHDAHELGIARGDASYLPWPLMRLAHVELLAGDWAQAEIYAETGLDVARQTHQVPLEADLLGTRALILTHLGEIEDARATGEKALELAESSGAGIGARLAQWALGFLDLGLGDHESAYARLAELRSVSRSAGVVDPGENRYLGDLGEVLVALGRTTDADELADELEALGVSLERPSAIAVASRVRGLAALERGETEAAREALERALAGHDVISIPFDRARTLLALGSALRRVRQRKAARETLQDAVAIFDGLGAALWAVKARAELSRIGGRARSARGFTPTEQRVAELVAEGRSNKEVAAAMSISVHTVEAALTSIYRKLEVHSRTEMAHALAEAD